MEPIARSPACRNAATELSRSITHYGVKQCTSTFRSAPCYCP
jgi:hypothetical protein